MKRTTFTTDQTEPPAQGGTPSSGWTGTESRALALGLMILGAVVAIGGFVTMNTTLVLAYRGGTLANVHALCSSGIGGLAQAMNHSAAAACAAVNSDYTLASVALWGGLALAATGLVVLLVQRQHS